MNLPVIPGQVFHSDSQEVLDRAERSITMRETVQRACHKPPTASRQKYRESQGMQQPAWSRRTGSNPAVGQGRAFVPKGGILPHIPRGNLSPGGETNREVHGGMQAETDLHRDQGPAVNCSSQLLQASWEKIVSDPWVLSTLAHGYRLQFRRSPPPFSKV